VPRNPAIAKECLKESAALGCANAIYDFTRDALGTREIPQARKIIRDALQRDKLFDGRFGKKSRQTTRQEL
jgi:hypothetical protein